jgi:DivIVA domain-containing protein
MSHTRFPRVSRLRKGYHRRQVDAFLNRVEVALGGALPAPTAAEVRQAGFELVRGGYDTVAVDEALDALEERVIAAQGLTSGRRGRLDPSGEAQFLRGELTAPYMKRFPRATSLRRGYDVDDVDDFLDHVVAALDGGGPLTVEQVRAAAFRPRRGGYLEDAVDETLDRVVELLLLLRRHPAQP